MCDTKCPYCDKPLHCGATLKSDEYLVDLYQCANPECESTEFLVGCKEFWDILGQLIRTRKALDKTKKSLQELKDIIACPPDISYETCVSMYADGVLQEITALEQKEVK